jgi:hypothetical protein
VTANDGAYVVTLDTTKASVGSYTLRVSFSSATLTGSFTRTLSLAAGSATAQRASR